MEGIGLNPDRATDITSTLGQNVRDGRYFTRPEPNTFGLIEWGENKKKPLTLEDILGMK